MDTSSLVSRVGGLAVALGIGTALLMGQGIAHADPSDPGIDSPTADSGATAPEPIPTDSPSSSPARARTPLSETVLDDVTRIVGPQRRHGTPRPLSADRQSDADVDGPAAVSADDLDALDVRDDIATATSGRTTVTTDSHPAANVHVAPVDSPVAVPPTRGVAAAPVVARSVVSRLLSWAGGNADAGDTPGTPAPPPMVAAALAWVRRELDADFAPLASAHQVQAVQIAPAGIFSGLGEAISDFLGLTTTRPDPAPGDMTQTPYGDMGQWLLGANGQAVAKWIDRLYPHKVLYQPVNVIIVDRTSTTPEQATQKLNDALRKAGYGAKPGHSTGFQGLIDGVVYGQQPVDGSERAFSDAPSFLPNNHGRVFGPAPAADGQGYVWTAAFSRERVGIYQWSLVHVFVSFNWARDSLRNRLILTGNKYLGRVPMDNKVWTSTTTTSDHDGYAVVIELR